MTKEPLYGYFYDKECLVLNDLNNTNVPDAELWINAITVLDIKERYRHILPVALTLDDGSIYVYSLHTKLRTQLFT